MMVMVVMAGGGSRASRGWLAAIGVGLLFAARALVAGRIGPVAIVIVIIIVLVVVIVIVIVVVLLWLGLGLFVTRGDRRFLARGKDGGLDLGVEVILGVGVAPWSSLVIV
jgi:hypothetical protein